MDGRDVDGCHLDGRHLVVSVASPPAERGPATRAVWILAAVLGAAALGLTLWVPARHPILHSSWLTVMALAAAFALADAVPVHFELRREAISFSLTIIPLVVGMYSLGIWPLVAARLVATGGVLVILRRQAPLKLAVNLTSTWLETAVACAVFSVLIPAGSGVGVASWPAAFAATAAGAVVLAAALAAGISLYQRQWESSLALMGAATVGGAAIETSLGVVAATLLHAEPLALLPLGVVGALVLASYRAQRTLRQKHRDLEQLYDYAGMMGDALATGRVVGTALHQARELMHADVAWLVVSRDGVQTEIRVDDQGEPVLSPAGAMGERLHAAAQAAGGPTLASAGVTDRERDHRSALVAPLSGASGLLGTLVVASRSGKVRDFTASDLRRMSALAGHAAVAFENSDLVERLRRQAAESRRQSLHDSLTGLPNRDLFSRRLDEALVDGATVAVLLIDLDRFKEVNDTLGHDNGDRLLEQVGARLTGVLRRGDLIARLGGDEFAVILPDVQGEASAVQAARSVLEQLEQPFAIEEMSVDVGASIGIALYPAHGSDVGTLVRRADVAMYVAKSDQTGVEVYAADRDGFSPARLSLVGELRRAIHERELEVHYQPQVDLEGGGVFGFEALVRWRHPERGLISPDDFISVAEHTGLIRPLTQLVLDEALAECRRWREAGWPLRVSVNLSPRSVLQPNLASDVAALLTKHRVPGGALCLEMTEGSMMADPRRTVEVLETLRARGISIAVDDFGTGYSSLAYLKGLPVDELKIDKSFVLHMLEDPSDEAIVRTVLDLARNLRLPVVAEGVEDEATTRRLRDMGCRSAQGYHFGRPVPGPELMDWLPERVPAMPDVVAFSVQPLGLAVLP